jgi:hypothetical protein
MITERRSDVSPFSAIEFIANWGYVGGIFNGLKITGFPRDTEQRKRGKFLPQHCAVLSTPSPYRLLVFSKNENPKGGQHNGYGRQDTRRASGVDAPFYPRHVGMIVENGYDQAVDEVENATEDQEAAEDCVFGF